MLNTNLTKMHPKCLFSARKLHKIVAYLQLLHQDQEQIQISTQVKIQVWKKEEILESIHKKQYQERNLKKLGKKFYIISMVIIIIKYVQTRNLLSLYPVKMTYLVDKSRGLGWETQ